MDESAQQALALGGAERPVDALQVARALRELAERQRVVRRVARNEGTGEVERSLGPGFERGAEVLCKERVELGTAAR